jgi:pSer/pThr/pTyr-binding forkhead associated (FHA) protein
MHAQLIPLDGTASVDILKDLTLVGRREDCDLRLPHKSISKMHCIIVKTDGLLFLRDLGSTNGTRVNGQRVRRAALLPNDELAIAGHKFRVSLLPGQAVEEPHGRTQQLDPKEIADLRQRIPAVHEAGQIAASPAQPNPLPDRYPESEAEVS